MKSLTGWPDLRGLRCALESAKYTAGWTHNFYLYPARFSPEIARAVIDMFSNPGDSVMDPFMGGGTTIIEGLALGRRMIGIDLNALAHFVASVRTKPLSPHDETVVRRWATNAARHASSSMEAPPRIKNLPYPVREFISEALSRVSVLPFARQRDFARCVLLRLGQLALDCRDHRGPSRRMLAARLPTLTDHMLAGLRDFVEACGDIGIRKTEIASRRILICRNAIGLDEEPQLAALDTRPRLIFTSPPYPGVHVLYHRWQVQGRKETPAPYWIADVPDGYYASHYTGGSRTPTGEHNYYLLIKAAFTSIRKILAPDCVVAQLIGFADIEEQLPTYLATMSEAGFERWVPDCSQKERLWRYVPNRKWYAKLQGAVDASTELLLFHRPRRRRVSA